MSFVTLEETTRLIGRSRQTIYRHVRSGKVSRVSDGSFDTAELMRAYGELKIIDTNKKIKNENNEIPVLQPETNIDTDFFKNEISLLHKEIKDLKTEFKEREKRSNEREDRLMRILEHNPAKEKEEERSFFSFFKL